jgi:peptidoglycan-associated lipoprotein
MKLKSFAIIGLLGLTLLASSCSTAKKKTEEVAPDTSGVVTDNGKNAGIGFDLNGDSDSNKAGALKTVYFEFNSASLSSETKETLNNNAQFLKTNPKVKLQVEGHADERGGVQFNLALAEKRAKGVREYLIGQGVEGGRLTTISFGKERPVAFGHDEEAWSKNRRANFLVTAK